MEDKHDLRQLLSSMGIGFNDEKVAMLERFYEMLIERNKEMNLTAITERGEVMRKHFADSLALLSYHGIGAGQKVLDLGTGAGFPGIPLKIFVPDTEFLLVDSVNKKLSFVSDVIEELGLKDIAVRHGRAEELAQDKEYREKFDIVVSRAVAGLPALSELALGFVKKGGFFISYKGRSGEDEAVSAEKAIATMGGRLQAIEKFRLAGEDERCLIFIRKEKETSKTYPRRTGLPVKKPLG